MGKEISSEEKYNVRQILRGEMSQRYAAEILGMHWSSVQAWVRLYESEGAAALVRNGQNRGYGTEAQWAAVQEYLAGKRGPERSLKHIKFGQIQRSCTG